MAATRRKRTTVHVKHLDPPPPWQRGPNEYRRTAMRRRSAVANQHELMERHCNRTCPKHCQRIPVVKCRHCGNPFPTEHPQQRYCPTCRFALDALRQHKRYHTRPDRNPSNPPLFCDACRFHTERVERLRKHGEQKARPAAVPKQAALPEFDLSEPGTRWDYRTR